MVKKKNKKKKTLAYICKTVTFEYNWINIYLAEIQPNNIKQFEKVDFIIKCQMANKIKVKKI